MGTKATHPNQAVFLDRDGTLNEDPGYLSKPAQMKLLPGVGEALARLKDAGYLLIVVSNQSGVGRGMIVESELPKIHARLDELLAAFEVSIHSYELCFHHPDEDCECRKPKPKLILDSATRYQVDLSRSYMVGDKWSDLGAGRAANCKGVALVLTGSGEETLEKLTPAEKPDFTGTSLTEVADWILGQETSGS